MKKLKLLCAVLMLAALCACTAGENPPAETERPPDYICTMPADPNAGKYVATNADLAPAPTAGDGQMVFTRETLPRMDGSTSLVPLGQAVAAVLLGESREDVSDLISFNRTSQSFRSLMYGSADILLSAEPAQSIFDEMEETGFEYEMVKIASDALVFVVNSENPIDSLTTDQIRDIYTGNITNWSQVGGSDVPIIAFQRNNEAGSQAAMEKYVMAGTEMSEPPSEYVIGDMMGLMEAVRSFDGSEGAIGYSVYYYANDMKMADGLKIIAVDGVEPAPGAIRELTYPHVLPIFTVIAKSAPEGSAGRMVFNWLQSEDGQRLINSQNYVSVMDFE